MFINQTKVLFMCKVKLHAQLLRRFLLLHCKFGASFYKF